MTISGNWFHTALFLVASVFPATSGAQEYECSITERSALGETIFLGKQGYRIQRGVNGFDLSRKSADGWIAWGKYRHMPSSAFVEQGDDFDIFLAMPDKYSAGAYVSMITIHKRSRNIAIFSHTGSFGNSSQYQRGEMLQGQCESI